MVRPGYLPPLTGLRGVAAVAVLVFHAYATYVSKAQVAAADRAGVITWLWIGVDLFFVLSAFLLALPLIDRPDAVRQPSFWRRYLIGRWFRIAPAYYASMLLVPFIAIGLGRSVFHGPHDLLLHLTFLHSLNYDTLGSMNVVYWTLAIEFQFYLLLPFLVWALTRRRAGWILAGMVAATLLYRAATYDVGSRAWLSFQVPGFLAHFALGVAAARLHKAGWPRRVPGDTLVLLLGITLVAAPLAGWIPHGSFDQGIGTLASNIFLRPMLAVAIAGTVLLLTTVPTHLGRFLSSPGFDYLGKTSYSLYLVHVPVQVIMGTWAALVAVGPTGFILVTSVASFAVTLALYYGVELPSLRLRSRTMAAARTRTQTARARAPSATAHPEPAGA